MSKVRRRDWVTGAKVAAMLAGIAGFVLGSWIAQPDKNTSAESWSVFFTHIDWAIAGPALVIFILGWLVGRRR